MIIEAVFNVLVFLLLGMIGLFPAIPAINFDFLNGVVRVLSLVDLFVSLRALSACLVVIFVLHNAGVLWGAVMWVARKIPGIQ